MKKILDLKEIGLITTFENITRTTVKDHFTDPSTNTLIFLVKPGQLSKAIGKNGITIKRASERIKKKIKVIELSNNSVKFFNMLISPLKPTEVKQEEEKLVVTCGTTQTKAQLMGRNKQKLLFLREIMKKHFGIEIELV